MINLRACETVSASTAFHSQELGFRTILVEDASRGIKVMLIMILIDMMLCDEDYDLMNVVLLEIDDTHIPQCRGMCT